MTWSGLLFALWLHICEQVWFGWVNVIKDFAWQRRCKESEEPHLYVYWSHNLTRGSGLIKKKTNKQSLWDICAECVMRDLGTQCRKRGLRLEKRRGLDNERQKKQMEILERLGKILQLEQDWIWKCRMKSVYNLNPVCVSSMIDRGNSCSVILENLYAPWEQNT